MKLTDYCLVARLTNTELSPALTHCNADPDAEVFDLAEGKNIVIVNKEKFLEFQGGGHMPYNLSNSKKCAYCMLIVGETNADNKTRAGQIIASAETKKELYNLYAEMYEKGIIGTKESRYLPKIKKFVEEKCGIKHM